MTGFKAYRGQQVQTSSPLELVLLAYEVLSSALYRASEAQKQKDFQAEAQHAAHALEAVAELMNGLNYEEGGDIAANLGSLYVYITQQVLDAQGSNDPNIYAELLGVVNELRSGWMELKNRQQRQPNQSAPQDQRIALAA